MRASWGLCARALIAGLLGGSEQPTPPMLGFFGVPIVNFGYAGDGNIHVNVMVDLAQPGMEATVQQVLQEIFRATVGLGGAVSGEHGIGTAKAPYIGLELDAPTLAAMRAIKAALDPHNIMNPGKVFAL